MKEPYRVIIVDDEPPARDIIEVFVERVPGLEIVAICTNALEALQAIYKLKPDLVFLDIQMPEMTGLELMNLPLMHRPDFVLTTAYPQYALKSYEFSVLDYLLKPVDFGRFLLAINKFLEKHNGEDRVVASATKDGYDSMEEKSVWLRDEKRLLQVPYEEILYVEGMKDYVKVYLSDQTIVSHLTIGKAAEMLRPPAFIRIHRSHIVRRLAIRIIDGNNMKLINGTELKIGPSYREELKKYISFLR